MNIKEITAVEASRLMNEGALMVDVRETDEVLHHAFQIEEVENIPMSNFNENWPDYQSKHHQTYSFIKPTSSCGCKSSGCC